MNELLSKPVDATAEVVAEPELRALYNYWRNRHDGGAIPKRAAIDPLELGPQLLPYVMLVELFDGGTRFRFRLVGTDVAFGVDPTGQILNDAVEPGIYRDHIAALYRLGATTRRGLYSRFGYDSALEAPRAPATVSRLFLPLEEQDEVPTMMLVGQMRHGPRFLDRSLWQARPAPMECEALFRLAGDG